MKRLLAAMLASVAGATPLASAQAADRPLPFTDLIPHADLKQLTDPTILTRQLWLETEWSKFTDGTHVVTETLGVLWAWGLSPDQDWAVRLKVPASFRVGSDVPGASDVSRVGRPQARDRHRVPAGEALAYRRRSRSRVPTGRHELSDNVWRIQEFGALAWDIEPWLTVSPSFEYDQSLAEERSAAPAHFLEGFFPLTVTLPRKWAAAVSYENRADFEADGSVTHRAKMLVAKAFESVPLSVALSAKRTFDAGAKQVQVNFVVTYFFR